MANIFIKSIAEFATFTKCQDGGEFEKHLAYHWELLEQTHEHQVHTTFPTIVSIIGNSIKEI